MTFEIRTLTAADAEAGRRLGGEAFGMPRTPPTEPATWDPVGQVGFGAFDGRRLAARMIDRDFDSYFGGALVPTSGIAGVTVTAEDRGQRLLTSLFDATFAEARERGAVISTLHPSAPKIYRRFGYAVISDYYTAEVPSAVLGMIKAPPSIRLRRATADDHEAIRQVYDRWAVAQNGPLTRRGVSFEETAEKFLSEVTAVTVAVDDDDHICGYASWDRGHGTSLDEVMEVRDVFADHADGYRALLAMLGTFSSVAGQIRIDTSGDDLIKMFIPTLHWKNVHSSQYMLKIIDVPGAFAARGYPGFLDLELGFRLDGDPLAVNNGSYRLQVAGGRAVCRLDDQPAPDVPVFTSEGLALAYAGAQSSANLRASGQLSGGTPESDEQWDTVFGGRQLHIRDHF